MVFLSRTSSSRRLLVYENSASSFSSTFYPDKVILYIHGCAFSASLAGGGGGGGGGAAAAAACDGGAAVADGDSVAYAAGAAVLLLLLYWCTHCCRSKNAGLLLF